MALFETINVIGFTLYLGFAILLLWLSRIPRTNAGADSWGIAIFFGFCARFTLYLSGSLFEVTATEHLYAFFITLEKIFLLLGAFRFFKLPHYTTPYLCLAALALTWILASWIAEFNRLVFSFGVGLFNAAALLFLALIAYRERDTIPNKIMLWVTVICILFSAHWLTYPILRFISDWMVPGFLIGTSLALLLYLSLISAVLLQFQKRLLDAELHALDLAYHDPLTGLNNKRYMTTLFDQALILATRPHQMLAVIYIDLDNFKPINDSAGHMVGDEVLKVIAKRLLDNTRSTDICARIGGDEFVVIATQLESAEHATQIAEKILQQCCSPVDINQHHYQLGASIGVSIYPAHGNDLNQLLQQADQAMYDVKKNGKSGFQVFHHATANPS